MGKTFIVHEPGGWMTAENEIFRGKSGLLIDRMADNVRRAAVKKL